MNRTKEPLTSESLQALIAGSEGLAPCPFCSKTLDPVDDGRAYLWAHPIDDCVMSGTAYLAIDQEGIARWNKRDPALRALATELLAAREALDKIVTICCDEDPSGDELEDVLTVATAALPPKEPSHE